MSDNNTAKASSQPIATPNVSDSAWIDKYVTAFDNLNTLNDMVLGRAHKLLKDDTEDDKRKIQDIINGEKPTHFTDEEWKNYKSLGQRLMNLQGGSNDR